MVESAFHSVRVGQRITATHTFTAREIQATADLIGDDNYRPSEKELDKALS